MLWDKDFVFVQGAYSICYKGVNEMNILDLSLISSSFSCYFVIKRMGVFNGFY